MLTLIVFFFFVRDPGGLLPRLLVRASSSGRAATRSSHPEAGGGVAFFAHIGGFAFGVLTVRLFRCARPLRPAVDGRRSRSTSARALDSLPPDLARGLENVAVVVEEREPRRSRTSTGSSTSRRTCRPGSRSTAGRWSRTSATTRPRSSGRSGHGAPRARALLRDRRGPARRARLRVNGVLEGIAIASAVVGAAVIVLLFHRAAALRNTRIGISRCPPRRRHMPKLLVVDDEPLICQSFHWVFATGEVEVATAGTIAEGWRRVEEDRPDVIVLDLQLPDGIGA